MFQYAAGTKTYFDEYFYDTYRVIGLLDENLTFTWKKWPWIFKETDMWSQNLAIFFLHSVLWLVYFVRLYLSSGNKMQQKEWNVIGKKLNSP